MNEVNDIKPNFWPKDNIGITTEQYMELSQEAKFLYTSIFDYCTYASDPQYQRLHKYRASISKLTGRDQELLISYFNNDPAIRWHGMPLEPYEYYRKPYDQS